MKVLYFAHTKEIVDRREDQFTFTEPVTVEAFRAHLYMTYPKLQGEKFQLAVNEEFVRETDMIMPHDVVALIPPVSGG
ncbi:MoaD/ThiS family protein [Macrococcus carouselicus]|uniref:Molybdopterin synthase sulfur carrier subunit n=1 Tax=Macrococcus carouselicus TaxID=69969 RepID=A0A9Q8FPT2_9STAP|nr:MoaD/ThiS family protein [Macrococcus carouselicus]TDM02314.1 MoaD/ThiS family protein [Macrococcus carouselicus]